jgi:hypothetical protein
MMYVICYDIWYVLTASGVPPGDGAVCNCIKIVNKNVYKWRGTVHRTVQKHRTHKIEAKIYTTKKQT